MLQIRAELLQTVRQFFYARQVMEVDTPLLASSPVTDPFLQALTVPYRTARGTQTYYLQTSPEYAMKRLLAAGSGSIYQLCKAFREDEVGSRHNPEFTMLEWYRVGFNDGDLMQEMDALLQLSLNTQPAEYLSYKHAFERYLHIDPHTASQAELERLVWQQLGTIPKFTPSRNDCLNLLFSAVIEPHLGQASPTFIYHYPASMAALAKRRIEDGVEVAARFEVYVKGIELANGYYELTDPVEQRKRFNADLKLRQDLSLPSVPIDEHLMSALTAGLPDCAGVALGFDRLCLLACGAKELSDVIAFPFTRA